MSSTSNYGFGKFLGDAIMTILTGGLWLIWVFVREMRRS
jgi:ABC-type Na+ efflux pump permease subunit